MPSQRKKMGTNAASLAFLNGIFEKSVNEAQPKKWPSSRLRKGPVPSAVAIDTEHGAPNEINQGFVSISIDIDPVRQPFDPPAPTSKGFTRFRPRAIQNGSPTFTTLATQTSTSTLEKLQLFPQDHPATKGCSQTSIIIAQPGNFVNTSLTATKHTTLPGHFKSLSDPALETKDIEGLRNIFGNLLARVEEKRTGKPAPPAFKPARMLLEQQGLLDDKPAFRTNGHPYMGDIEAKSFQEQITDLPADENCALWLLEVPPQVTHADIFRNVDTGAVYAVHVNSPNADHPKQGVKLVFMRPEGARRLKALSDKGMFSLGGKRIRVRYNRNGYQEQTKNISRVVYIEGPTWLMTEERWADFFKASCVCTLEYVGTISDTGRIKKMEFRFARVDGQAMTCLQAISKNKLHRATVSAGFGLDPCDRANRKKPKIIEHDWCSDNPSQKFNPFTAKWRA